MKMLAKTNQCKMKIGIRANLQKEGIEEALKELIFWLKKNKFEVILFNKIDQFRDRQKLDVQFLDQKKLKQCNLLIVLGGDGTLLSSARLIANLKIPMLSINFGGLGFLTEIDFNHAKEAIRNFIKGKFRIEERTMLSFLVKGDEEKSSKFLALNDIVISKSSISRMVRFTVFINEQLFSEFPADGIIVSTSTGSTAYSLSAGGPIVNPEIDILILTPICPHTLFARSLIVPPTEKIKIFIPPSRKDITLTVDGQVEFPLKDFQEVIIQKAQEKAIFVRFKQPQFYETVRKKFNLK